METRNFHLLVKSMLVKYTLVTSYSNPRFLPFAMSDGKQAVVSDVYNILRMVSVTYIGIYFRSESRGTQEKH